MSLIKCFECQSEVSNKALACPKCGARLRKPKRGFFGTLFKWSFIGFNLLMLLWLFSYWGTVGQMSANESEMAQTGYAIGATMGTGAIVSFWCFGDVILGLLVLFTRAK